MPYIDQIETYLSTLKEVIDQLDRKEINKAIQAIVNKYEKEATIFIFGNGGSAATASHFLCDFNKGACLKSDKKFRFVCLNDNVPIMTAISNDFSYEEVYAYQLKNLAKKDDLVIAISGSGNSKNIVKAIEVAKNIGCEIIGITGYDGGKLKEMSDYNLHVNINDMQKVEDVHMIFDHMIMQIIFENL